MNEIIKEFAEVVKLNRRKQLLTQEQLAEKASLGVSTIRNLERGALVDLKLSTMQKIIKSLNIKFKLNMKGGK